MGKEKSAKKEEKNPNHQRKKRKPRNLKSFQKEAEKNRLLFMGHGHSMTHFFWLIV
jgi:uncharacterized protein YxeA